MERGHRRATNTSFAVILNAFFLTAGPDEVLVASRRVSDRQPEAETGLTIRDNIRHETKCRVMRAVTPSVSGEETDY